MSCILLRCKVCRTLVIDSENVILTGHGIPLNSKNFYANDESTECSQIVDNLYVEEVTMPAWISEQIDETGWRYGKINCLKCNARLGSFDFVHGRRCACNTYILPPIHIVKCKVDWINRG